MIEWREGNANEGDKRMIFIYSFGGYRFKNGQHAISNGVW